MSRLPFAAPFAYCAIEVTEGGLVITVPRCVSELERALFIAVQTDPLNGSAVVPFGKDHEGSTVFLPFRANAIYTARFSKTVRAQTGRQWLQTQWSERFNADDAFDLRMDGETCRIILPLTVFSDASRIRLTLYLKEMDQNDGWGRIVPDRRFRTRGGLGDQPICTFQEIDLAKRGIVSPTPQWRLDATGQRVRIYQLLPRLFGNINERRKVNGTLLENGAGKFSDINETALSALKNFGVSHLWLTGILRQATGTDYSQIGLPADIPDLLKGLAGSPYAIKDYFDVCPDYAIEPENRLKEFQALITRIHDHGMRMIIDFVPNHVARSYASKVKPELSFGLHDNRQLFFHPENHFYWLQPGMTGGGPPLRLPTVRDGEVISPTCRVLGSGDGRFPGELDCGRVSGNNAVSWRPALSDWYETVKLNYGFDFTVGRREYPEGNAPEKAIPDTWLKMDQVIAYWQAMGVDGFRCDMAHMVPPEFWSWAIARARMRGPNVFFVAEAYDNDPMKVPGGDPLLAALNDRRGNVMFDLLNAGFNAVYDDPSYKTLKAIYDGSAWANDLDGVLSAPFIFQNSLRYAENHDEVRLAGKNQWGNVGSAVGRAVTAILWGISSGPVLLYHGQETGEPAAGEEGFGGDDARTTIFDYWSMPEFTKWVNGHQYDGGGLSDEQKALREFYQRLLHIVSEPAFHRGDFFGLNSWNICNAGFGRMAGENASGHWLYAFLRYDPESGQRYLVVCHLHPREEAAQVQLQLPQEAFEFLELPRGQIRLEEQLEPSAQRSIPLDLSSRTVCIDRIPPLTPLYFLFRIQAT